MIRIISFTKNGIRLSEKIAEHLEAKLFSKCREEATGPYHIELSIEEWAKEGFQESCPLLFIGATGIAVRAIADCVKDKLSDSPVLVMDEQGCFIIPLLSGHVGGANALALQIAEITGAVPVITTATDRNDVFSADLFAKENHLSIVNRDGIKEVSAKAIEGKPIRLSIQDYPPKENTDVVVTSDEAMFSVGKLALCPKKYAVGMGCKKDKPAEELEAFFVDTLATLGIDCKEVGCISSISVKENEPGLLALSQKYRLPFLTFEAEVLEKVKGDFSSSEFVAKQVGVDNVCERAALAAVGTGKLLLKKKALDGMTIAVAIKE